MQSKSKENPFYSWLENIATEKKNIVQLRIKGFLTCIHTLLKNSLHPHLQGSRTPLGCQSASQSNTPEGEARILSGITCKGIAEKTEGRKSKSGSEEHTQGPLAPLGNALTINLLLKCTFNVFPLTWRKYSPSSVTPLRFLTSLQLLGNSPETKQKYWATVHQNFFCNTVRHPKHQNTLFIFKRFPWSALVLSWMAPNAWKYCLSLGVWWEKMLKPWERQRKVQICRLTVMDVVTCPPLFGFQIHVAQAADLVIVRQTLHRPVHDSNSTGDGALQDRRQRFLFYLKGCWAPEEQRQTVSLVARDSSKGPNPTKCSNTGLILIKQVIPFYY